jgi:hypothetical protein
MDPGVGMVTHFRTKGQKGQKKPTLAQNCLKMASNGPQKILYDPESDPKEQNGPNRLPNDSESAPNGYSMAENNSSTAKASFKGSFKTT